MKNMEKLFEFYQLIEKLKTTTRYSTQEKFRESTAEHSWKLAMMALVTADEMDIKLNITKALKLAIIHDLPELICGDVDNVLLYDGKVSEQEKYDAELESMKKVIEPL